MKNTLAIPKTFLGVGYTKNRAGLPLEAVRVPVPLPGADQVLIRVAAPSLNPLEYKLADLNFFARTPPVVLGLHLSGIVVAIGSAVRGIAVGDSVVAMADLSGDGGWVAGGGRRRLCAREGVPYRAQAGIPELPRWGSSADVLPFSLRGPQRHCPSR
ncbi:alcohol dehydrogenase catalytic domain-containing protein [Edaphobacter aggregans]|uniref:alcohol dehydrogenase catalytic domain-containing protein n=1 Tax=Edaphobacter aggregans TaxID=570835 RepID=UPI00146FEB53|nr:alcohol dehydrogenase catalytic domain-containing protein [Edaphobacter aggregans]